MEKNEKSKLEELSRSLYSPSVPDIRSNRRPRSSENSSSVSTDWEHDTEPESPQYLINQSLKDKTMSFFTKIFLTSLVFFLVALGIGAYLFFNGANIVSGNNVDITISGPLSIGGGEPVTLGVQISNHNNIKLENIEFSVEYPSGTIDAHDSLKELRKTKESLSDISPGGIGQKTLDIAMYGEENSKKEIKVSIEYGVKGSNARFTKEKTIDLIISSSPLTLSVTSFKEVTSGQEFSIGVELQSNSKDVLKNIVLKGIFPFGFSLVSSNIKPGADGSTWEIGDLPPRAKKTITIKGKLDGQDDELRVLRFSAGSARIGTTGIIGTEYTSGSQEIAIKKPFMSVDISLGNDSSNKDFVTSFNTPVIVEITYRNNLPTPITDGEIRMKLSGNAFDKASVSPGQGVYRSEDNEIVWNGITTKNLQTLDAGDEGKVSFTITPRNTGSSFKVTTDPDLKFSVSVKAKRNSEANVPESIVSTASRRAKVATNISLGGQILRNSQPFINTGAIPPKAEQQTTYTVIWTIDNTSSNISNVKVESSLPPHVTWLGKIDPTNDDVSYNKVSGEIVWNVGSVGTNTAGSSKRRQLAFQIGLKPSISQIGQTPVLVNQTSITAEDDFTGQELKSNVGSLNTRFSTDPSFKDGDDKVVK